MRTSIYYSLLVFAAAFFIRPLYLFHAWTFGDSGDYLEIADSLKASGEFMLNGAPTTFRPPLYPILLSIFDDWTILVQYILGALTCVLVYLIAKSIWPALLYAMLPLSAHYSVGIATETLFVFLVVLGVHLWRQKEIYLAGIVFGMAGLARPTALVLLAFAFVVLIRQYRREVAIMLGIALFLCLPWIVRNSLIDERFTLTQKSALGTNLLYGTFTHEEFGPTIWDKALKRYPVKDNDFMLAEAGRRIKEDPVNYIQARVEQYPRLYIDTVDYLTSDFTARFVIVLLQVGLFVLAIFGLLAKPDAHIWIVPLFLAVFHLPLWIETRYFLPAMPFVCILAWYGVLFLQRRLIERRERIQQHGYISQF